MEANNYNGYSDSDLVILLRDGDELAYTEIYNRYKVSLYTFIYDRLPDEDRVFDILHDLFMVVWEKRLHITYNSSLSGYLFTSARNKILDILAHEKIKRKYIDSFADFVKINDFSTDSLVLSKEIMFHVNEEVSKLPTKTKQVFELSRNSNLSRSEIAEELGVSEETVKSHMHKALKILKLKLGSNFLLIFF